MGGGWRAGGGVGVMCVGRLVNPVLFVQLLRKEIPACLSITVASRQLWSRERKFNWFLIKCEGSLVWRRGEE